MIEMSTEYIKDAATEAWTITDFLILVLPKFNLLMILLDLITLFFQLKSFGGFLFTTQNSVPVYSVAMHPSL